MTENEFLEKLFRERDALPTDEARAAFDHAYFVNMKNPVVQYGYNYFLGWLGVDRFTLGKKQVGFMKLALGVLAILSLVIGCVLFEEGGEENPGIFLGMLPIMVWVFVDFFVTPGVTRDYNARLLETTKSQLQTHDTGRSA